MLARVIDPDYTGEIVVVLFNFGKLSRTIAQGQRIAQVIFENIPNPTVQMVKQLPQLLDQPMDSIVLTNYPLYPYLIQPLPYLHDYKYNTQFKVKFERFHRNALSD